LLLASAKEISKKGKCVVTGGAGFIGSNLGQALLAKGFEVVVVDVLSSGNRSNIAHLPVTFVETSIEDGETLKRVMKGADAVFHLAASVGNKRSIDAPLRDSEINVLGTLQ